MQQSGVDEGGRREAVVVGVGVQTLGKEILPFCLLIRKTREISLTLLEFLLRHAIHFKRQVVEVRQEESKRFLS